MGERTWSIGELAAEFDTTLRTIRFYEDRGLLAPERVGTTRIFHDRERVRLQLILRGKRLGFTLTEIAHILDLYDEQPGELGQLEFLIADIDRRRRVLEAKRRDLDEALAELDALEKRCRADLAGMTAPTSVTRRPARRSRPAGRSRPTGDAPHRAGSTAATSPP
jgi:DNA-binding transcriptional MerR regulator